MTYYKKIERDKARTKHIEQMKKLADEWGWSIGKPAKFCELYARLRFMEKQLKLYDEVMGYKLEL
jgi:hypothetical protein